MKRRDCQWNPSELQKTFLSFVLAVRPAVSTPEVKIGGDSTRSQANSAKLRQCVSLAHSSIRVPGVLKYIVLRLRSAQVIRYEVPGILRFRGYR